MTLESDADLNLLNGLLLVTSDFLPLFPVFNFPTLNIYLYTVQPSVLFCLSSWSNSWGVLNLTFI